MHSTHPAHGAPGRGSGPVRAQAGQGLGTGHWYEAAMGHGFKGNHYVFMMWLDQPMFDDLWFRRESVVL